MGQSLYDKTLVEKHWQIWKIKISSNCTDESERLCSFVSYKYIHVQQGMIPCVIIKYQWMQMFK